jgi:hypothetical protein
MNAVLPPADQLQGELPQEQLLDAVPPTEAPLEQAIAPQMEPPTGEGVLAPIQKTQEGGNPGYSGVVSVNGNPVEVVDGVAEFEGQTFFISKDGSMVMTQQAEVVGSIQNGEFIPIDEAYLEQLRAAGKLED